MFKRVEVVMLPTNEKAIKPLIVNPSIGKNGKMEIPKHKDDYPAGVYQAAGYETFHLYFLSDEEIKDDDWFINLISNNVFQYSNKYGVKKGNIYANYALDLSTCKKIIATTDKSLTINSIYGIDSFDSSMFGGKSEKVKLPSLFNLPQPSQSFIEKFVEEYNKGNVIREVMVEYEEKTFEEHWYCEQTGERNFDITPPMGKTWIRYWAHKDIYHILKIAKDNTITIRKVKDSWSREEVKELIIDAVSESHDWSRENNDVHSIAIIKNRFLNKWIEENV